MERRRILTAEQAEAQAHVLDSVTEVIGSGESVLLVGSGCSRPMFPAWGQLVEDLAGLAAQCIPDGFTLPERLLDDEVEALQYIREAMAGHQQGDRCLDRFEQYLIRTFEMKNHQPTRLHELLVGLPFRGYLTTNYERLVERALDQARGPRGDGRSLDLQAAAPYYVAKAIRAMADAALAELVIHLHGMNEHPESMVLTTDDYHRAYGIPRGRSVAEVPATRNRRPYAKVLLSALMLTRRVIFVGFGMRDPFLMRVLQAVTEHSWEWEEPIHYAIMPIEEKDAQSRWEEAQRLRSKYGVEVLFYEIYDGDHQGLPAILEEITARLGLVDRRMTGPGSETEPVTPPSGEESEGPKGQARDVAVVPEQFEQLTRARIQRNLSPLQLLRDTGKEDNRAD